MLNVIIRNLPTSFLGKRELEYCDKVISLVPSAWISGSTVPDFLVPIEDFLLGANLEKSQEAALAGPLARLLQRINSHQEAKRVAKQWNVSL